MTNQPWHSRFALTLALLLPVYFAVAALGTKFGLWSWQIGLGSLIIGAGPFLLGIVALVAIVAFVLSVRKAPRTGWLLAVIALAVPVGIFAMLGNVSTVAGANPIHDIATDTASPPEFSTELVALRTEAGSNPLKDYAAAGEDGTTHGALVSELYPDLTALPVGDASTEATLSAIASGMGDIGLTDIKTDIAAGTVEGVAETFWFGFKDDVVARVADGKIDFRSVSRVGQSDLGANSARIEELSAAVEARLSE